MSSPFNYRLENLRQLMANGRHQVLGARYLRSSNPFREDPYTPPAPAPSKKSISVAPVAWLSRPHPCPDIEDRIREVKSQS
ncbi:MAG: hypothetical protein AB7G35_21440 [Hyphomicrobiaceae bacterium]